MKPEILSVNLDSLYLTVHGEIASDVLECLKAAKDTAQLDDENGTYLYRDNRVAGGPLYVGRIGQGRDYPYVVYNARFRVALSTRGGNRPVALIQIRADLLYEYELPQINTMVCNLLGGLLVPEYSIKVNRVDIALDFQQPEFVMPELSDVSSRARKDFLWREFGKVTGMTFGQHQSALQVQIYRKSETLAKDGKQWMFEVWKAQNERFDPEISAYRVELRFYRDGLRLLVDPEGNGVNSIWNLKSSLGDLVDYALCSEKPWMRVTHEKYRGKYQGNQDKRIQNAPWWDAVIIGFRQNFRESQARKRVNNEARFLFSMSMQRAVAHLASAAAIARTQKWTRYTADPVRFARDSLESYFSDDALLWADLVNERTHRLVGHITGHVAEVA